MPFTVNRNASADGTALSFRASSKAIVTVVPSTFAVTGFGFVVSGVSLVTGSEARAAASAPPASRIGFAPGV